MTKYTTKDAAEKTNAMVISYKEHATRKCMSTVHQLADQLAARQTIVTIATEYRCRGLLRFQPLLWS